MHKYKKKDLQRDRQRCTAHAVLSMMYRLGGGKVCIQVRCQVQWGVPLSSPISGGWRGSPCVQSHVRWRGGLPVQSHVQWGRGGADGGLSSPRFGTTPPVNRQTENITFPQTPCVGGNKKSMLSTTLC